MREHLLRLASATAMTALMTAPGVIVAASDAIPDPSPSTDARNLASEPPAAENSLPAPYGPPPANADFDYQIGGDYDLPAGVEVVSRDWFIGTAPEGIYAICYVNAFQTQGDDPDVDRPDERSDWPSELVLSELGDDPNWDGEYLIDISTDAKRTRAAAWIEPMVRTCRDKGFEAVEYDNLDSWSRFDGTPMADRVPFARKDTIAYAELLVALAHEHGLAAAQKNTVQLPREISLDRIGFDFAIAEECGRWDECQDYMDVFGDHVIDVEYRKRDFKKACRQHGDVLSVVLRDLLITTPDSDTYVYRDC